MAGRSLGFILTRNEVIYWFALAALSLFTYRLGFGEYAFPLAFGFFVTEILDLWHRRSEAPEPIPRFKSIHWHSLTTSAKHLREQYIPELLARVPSKDRNVELFLSRLMLTAFVPLGYIFYFPLIAIEVIWSSVFQGFEKPLP